MLKKALLLFTVILFTGCVERGYDLTVNNKTNTVTAIKSVDIRTKATTTTKADIEKMNTAVHQEQTKQPSPNKTIKKQDNELKKVDENKKHREEKQLKAEKELEKQKELENRKKIEAEKLTVQQERKELEQKLAKEKEEQRLSGERERASLAKKARIEKEVAKKNEEALTKIKATEEKEAMEKKLAQEKVLRETKEKEAKLALERKIEKAKQAQLLKEKKEKQILEKKLAQEKKKAEEQIAEEKRVTLIKEKEATKKAEKIRLQQEAQARKEKEEQRKKASAHKKPLSATETLTFKPSSQTYQKFGTSEIHGHVVYLTPAGQEINLDNSKIYLVPKNTKTDYWYNKYYLKNKEATSLSKTIVHYINATHLNLEKNFAFYGLAPGIYYIIIESSYPSSIAKNKKVYIAKKINVEKYKKIMTVFSKKL